MTKVDFKKSVIAVTIGLAMISCGSGDGQSTKNETKVETQSSKIEGWFLAGNKPKSYKVGLDKSVYKTGGSSAFLESVDKTIEGFGTLMQTCLADEYLDKRVKMTAFIKSKDVSDWAGMWFRVDSKRTGQSLSFDNMQNRPIKGSTDWTKYEIILDVPEESATLNFGILLSGTGKVWFDDISFEVVDLGTKSTDLHTDQTDYTKYANKQPTNLNFTK